MLKWSAVKGHKKYKIGDADEKERLRDKYIETILTPNNIPESAIEKFRSISDAEIDPPLTWSQRKEEEMGIYTPGFIKSLFNRFYIPKALRAQIGTDKYTWSNVMKTDVYKNAPRTVDKQYVRKLFLEETQENMRGSGLPEDRIESISNDFISRTIKLDPHLSDNWEQAEALSNFMDKAGVRSTEFAVALSAYSPDELDIDIPKSLKGNEWGIIKYLKSDDRDKLILKKDWDLPESWHNTSAKVKAIHRKNLVKAEYQEGVESSLFEDPIFNMVIGGGLGKMGLKGLKAAGGYAKGAIDDLLFGLPSITKGAVKVATKGARKLTASKEVAEVAEDTLGAARAVSGDIPVVSQIDNVVPEVKVAGAAELPSQSVDYPPSVDLTGEFAKKRAAMHGEEALHDPRKVTPLSQSKLESEAKLLVDTDREKAFDLARNENSPLSVKVADELIDDTIRQYRIGGDPEVLKEVQELTGITSARTKLAGQISKAADRSTLSTPQDFIKFMGKEIGKFNKLAGRKLFKNLKKLPELSTKDIGEIVKRIDKINLIKDVKAREIALQKYTREITRRIPTPLVYKITSLRKAGLLTGPKGVATDVTSNLSHAVDQYLGQVFAASIDSTRAFITRGNRTIAMPKYKEAKKYITTAGKALKHGYDSGSLGFEKWDYMKVSYGTGKLAKKLEAIEQGVFKTRGYFDLPFYKGREAASIISHARLEGINLAKAKKLTGAKKAKFIHNHIDEISKNVPDHIALMAKRDAEIATFRTETDLGSAIRGLLKRPDIAKHVNVVGEFVTPFTRTMPSLVSQTAEMATGIPSALIKAASDKIANKTFDAAQFANKMGKGMVGAGAFALGAELERRGMINVAPAESEGESRLMQTARYGLGTVKVGDGYVPLYPLGPLGILIHVGAMYQHHLNETGSFAGGVYGATTKGIKLLGQSAYVQTLKNLLETASGDISPERFVGRSVKSFIPSLVSETARSLDPKQRRVEGVGDAVQGAIPGLREKLEPQVGLIGEEIESGEISFNKFFNPLKTIPEHKSPIIKEMLRLRQKGHNVAPSFVGDRKGYDILTPKENTIVWKTQGKYIKQIIGEIIRSEEYKKQDDFMKAITIKSLTKIAHDMAYNEIIQLKQEKIKDPEQGEILGNEIEQIANQQKEMIKELMNSGVLRSSKITRRALNESN